MSIRNFDSFTCCRYAVLDENPIGDFLDQLGAGQYFLYFSNRQNYDKAIWSSDIGLHFIEEDIFDEGFNKIHIVDNSLFTEYQFKLILQEGCLKENISDIKDTVNDKKIKFKYLQETDSAQKFGCSLAIICSLSEKLNIEINDKLVGIATINNQPTELDDIFGNFNEDDIWVLLASK